MRTIQIATLSYEAPNGKTYSVDFETMKQDPMYLVQYGVDQNLADAHAGAKAWAIKQLSDDKATADLQWQQLTPGGQQERIHRAIDVLVSKRIKALMDGTIRQGGRVVKDLAYYVDQIAAERIGDAWKKLDADAKRTKVQTIIANVDLKPAAAAILAEAQKRHGATPTASLDDI